MDKKGKVGNSTFVHNAIKVCTKGESKIREIGKYGIAAQGRIELITHHQGKRLTRDRAIRAYCYDCMGYYADGKDDCQQADCPLHPFMPYAPSILPLAATVQPLPAKNEHAPDRLDTPKAASTQKGIT